MLYTDQIFADNWNDFVIVDMLDNYIKELVKFGVDHPPTPSR